MYDLVVIGSGVTGYGAAMYAAIEVAKEIKSGVILAIFPDKGDKYLSTKLFKV